MRTTLSISAVARTVVTTAIEPIASSPIDLAHVLTHTRACRVDRLYLAHLLATRRQTRFPSSNNTPHHTLNSSSCLQVSPVRPSFRSLDQAPRHSVRHSVTPRPTDAARPLPRAPVMHAAGRHRRRCHVRHRVRMTARAMRPIRRSAAYVSSCVHGRGRTRAAVWLRSQRRLVRPSSARPHGGNSHAHAPAW